MRNRFYVQAADGCRQFLMLAKAGRSWLVVKGPFESGEITTFVLHDIEQGYGAGAALPPQMIASPIMTRIASIGVSSAEMERVRTSAFPALEFYSPIEWSQPLI